MSATSNTKLAAVVLAAGLSSRMGGLNKLLMDWRGKPLVQHALNLVASLELAQRVVVTGRDADAVSRVVPEGFEIAFNPRFKEGMGGSIAAGVGVLEPEIEGVLIFLGDMPDVQQADVLGVMDAFTVCRSDAPSSIIVPSHGGQGGHPVLFGREHFAELAQLTGDRGARGIVAAHAYAIIHVEASGGILRDIDTESDL